MTQFSRRAALALLGGAMLVPAAGMPAWAQAQPDVVRAPIVALYAALEKNMKTGAGAPFRARYDALSPVIDRVFDLPSILQTTVGLRWNSMDPAAKASLEEAFRRFTVASYVANFDKFGGETFEVGTTLRPVGQDQVVPSRMIPRSGDPIQMDYVMRQTPAGWRVVDVLLNGTVSRVAVMRSDFRSLLGSGDAGALIASLQRKVADLSGNTLS